MTFDEWAEQYNLNDDDDFPTRTGREIDCRAAWDAATMAEREACAKVAEAFDYNERPEIDPPRSLPRYVAQAIRMRTNK